jgi:hypothetical protein
MFDIDNGILKTRAWVVKPFDKCIGIVRTQAQIPAAHNLSGTNRAQAPQVLAGVNRPLNLYIVLIGDFYVSRFDFWTRHGFHSSFYRLTICMDIVIAVYDVSTPVVKGQRLDDAVVRNVID